MGQKDGKLDLYIPKHNWGGAFIKSGNDYKDEILCKKDGFEEINKENYIVNTVKVKNSEDTFKDLFTSIMSQNLYNGVIKIDVEGFERKVLFALANTLPSSLNIAIVFEKWGPHFIFIKLKNSFKNRTVSLLKIKGSIIGTSKSKLRKYYEFILFGEKTKLENIK